MSKQAEYVLVGIAVALIAVFLQLRSDATKMPPPDLPCAGTVVSGDNLGSANTQPHYVHYQADNGRC